MIITELRQNIWQRLEMMEGEKLTAVVDFLDSLDTSSSSQNHELEMGKSEKKDFWFALQEFRSRVDLESLDDDTFDNLRDKSPGRDVIL